MNTHQTSEYTPVKYFLVVLTISCNSRKSAFLMFRLIRPVFLINANWLIFYPRGKSNLQFIYRQTLPVRIKIGYRILILLKNFSTTSQFLTIFKNLQWGTFTRTSVLIIVQFFLRSYNNSEWLKLFYARELLD